MSSERPATGGSDRAPLGKECHKAISPVRDFVFAFCGVTYGSKLVYR
jgi:hypothetical protein